MVRRKEFVESQITSGGKKNGNEISLGFHPVSISPSGELLSDCNE